MCGLRLLKVLRAWTILLIRVSRSWWRRDYLQCIFIGRSVARCAVLPRPFIYPNPNSNLNAETSIEFVFHAYHPWKRSVIYTLHIYKCSQLISLNLRPINSRQSDTVSDIGVSCVPWTIYIYIVCIYVYIRTHVHIHTYAHYTRANTSEFGERVWRYGWGLKGEISHTHTHTHVVLKVHRPYVRTRVSA